jgi:ribosomal protein S18 acetylase RimI-like enzyme
MRKNNVMSQFATKDFEKLIGELFNNNFSKSFTPEDVARVYNKKNVYLFTHEEDGHIVGMATLYVVELLSRKLGVVEEVVTLKKYRNKGIASNLIGQILDKSKKLKLTCVELNVREDKPEIQSFYEKFGFYDRKNKSMRIWVNK